MAAKPKLNFQSSFDDGNYNDIYLANELAKIGLQTTFYIPTCTVLEESEIKQLSAVFEIGGHTVSHPPDLKRLPQNSLRQELRENREWLQQITGQPILKFAYPRGRYNEQVIDEVRQAGYLSARTTLVGRFNSDNPYRQHTTVHVFQRKEYGLLDWLNYAMAKAKECAGTDGVFHLWGHSDEVEQAGQWENMLFFFRWLQRNFNIINL